MISEESKTKLTKYAIEMLSSDNKEVFINTMVKILCPGMIKLEENDEFCDTEDGCTKCWENAVKNL